MACFDEFIDDFRVFWTDNRIFIFESSQTIEIIHVDTLVDICYIPKIDGFYVGLNLISKGSPVEVLFYLMLFAPII